MADIAASVLAKLRNKAKASGISYQQCLQLFVQEEFLRKLSKSGCEDTLILKGGLFIYTLTNFESRATIDVDFLLRGYSNSIDDVKELICKIIDTPTGNDYIEMRAKGFEEISPQRKYHGISTQIIAQIKNVRVPFNVDIGVGDIIVPRAEERTINTQLPDFEAPVIKTYSLESTIAEKFDAILQRFELTGRMKDFYDIYYLSRTFNFDGAKLQAAIFETLQRRGTPYDRDSFKRVVALADDEDIAEMSKREKKKSGSYKKSFLGFIFYNYLTFGAECSHCHFVSNNDFDKEVLLWQSYIEDGKRLQTENIALYEKIKDRIKNEFLDDMPSNFDSVFEEFIQNTFVHKSELQLTTYESQTMGKFFNHLADKNIPSNTANLIFQQLLNDVRKKSKEKIKVPISMKSLVEKKGVDIAQIGKKIDGNIKNSGNYDAFHDYLITQSLSDKDINRIESAKTLHDTRWLDVNDVKYQEIVVVLRKTISTYCESCETNGFNNDLKRLCIQELQKHNLLSDSLDKSLVEVLYYEQKFS